MAAKNMALFVNEYRIRKPETGNAVGYLLNLLLRVFAGIPFPGLQLAHGDHLDPLSKNTRDRAFNPSRRLRRRNCLCIHVQNPCCDQSAR